MRLRNSTPAAPQRPVEMPRHIEALEKVIEALEAGPAGEADAYRTITQIWSRSWGSATAPCGCPTLTACST